MSVEGNRYEHTDWRCELPAGHPDRYVTYYTDREGREPAFSIEINGRGTEGEVDAALKAEGVEEGATWCLVLGDMGYHEITPLMRRGIRTTDDACELASVLNETGYDEDAIGELIYEAVIRERAEGREPEAWPHDPLLEALCDRMQNSDDLGRWEVGDQEIARDYAATHGRIELAATLFMLTRKGRP
jgi:hypothetical protein